MLLVALIVGPLNRPFIVIICQWIAQTCPVPTHECPSVRQTKYILVEPNLRFQRWVVPGTILVVCPYILRHLIDMESILAIHVPLNYKPRSKASWSSNTTKSSVNGMEHNSYDGWSLKIHIPYYLIFSTNSSCTEIHVQFSQVNHNIVGILTHHQLSSFQLDQLRHPP